MKKNNHDKLKAGHELEFEDLSSKDISSEDAGADQEESGSAREQEELPESAEDGADDPVEDPVSREREEDHESEDTVDAAEFYEDSGIYEDDDAYEDDRYYSYSAESREKAARSRRRRAGMVLAEKIGLAVLCALLVLGCAGYVIGCFYFGGHFGFHTSINGTDVSCQNPETVEEEFTASSSSYILTIHGRNNVTDTISASQVSLSPSFDGSIETLLQEDASWKWPKTLFTETELTMPPTATYDSAALDSLLDTLSVFNPSNEIQPVNATYAFTDGSYQIVPEDGGSVPIRDAVLQAIGTALEEYQSDLTLGDECYESAAVTSENPELQETVAELNRLTGITVTIPFGDDTETLEGESLAALVSVPSGDTASVEDASASDASGGEVAGDSSSQTQDPSASQEDASASSSEIHFDAAQISAYVDSLAEKYDTCGKDREFKTTSGKTITVSGGNYGWKMDRTATAEALTAFLEEGTSGEVEPVWTQEAAQHGEDDIGSSYAEVDLDEQHVYLYIDGKCVVSTDCVSGKAIDSDRFTPDGTYRLLYRKSPAVLKGADYESPVTYWMPFNGGIGFHDAPWRSKFGGEIYLTAGSHGCINLPASEAKKIYANVYSGMPVVVFGGMKPEEAIKYTGQKPGSTKKPSEPEEASDASGTGSSSNSAGSASTEQTPSADAAQSAAASVVAQAVQNYMAQGMTAEQAQAQVQADLAAQLAAQQAAAAQGQE